MLRFCSAPQILVLIGLVLNPGVPRADAAMQGVGLAVIDFDYVDTSGEPVDQAAAHRQRLQTLMTALRRDLAADGRFRLVPIACRPAPCPDDGKTPSDALRAASEAGAKLLLIGGIHKQSTLVQWAKVHVIDIDADRVVLDRLFTFRGDSDEAWVRAESFVSRDILAVLAALPAYAATAAPIALAIFDFELDDVSAGSATTSDNSSDAAPLASVTSEVRQLLAQSGRYRLVDVGGADAAALAAHALRACDGCDAAIARQLGAEQSFVGVVKRISRTEYTMRFRIRDARTGTVLADEDSGLRMGADDSWNRGAARLIKDRLLEQ